VTFVLQERAFSFVLGCLFYAPSGSADCLLNYGLVDTACVLLAGSEAEGKSGAASSSADDDSTDRVETRCGDQ
jgi:hypothetical protein